MERLLSAARPGGRDPGHWEAGRAEPAHCSHPCPVPSAVCPETLGGPHLQACLWRPLSGAAARCCPPPRPLRASQPRAQTAHAHPSLLATPPQSSFSLKCKFPPSGRQMLTPTCLPLLSRPHKYRGSCQSTPSAGSTRSASSDFQPAGTLPLLSASCPCPRCGPAGWEGLAWRTAPQGSSPFNSSSDVSGIEPGLRTWPLHPCHIFQMTERKVWGDQKTCPGSLGQRAASLRGLGAVDSVPWMPLGSGVLLGRLQLRLTVVVPLSWF